MQFLFGYGYTKGTTPYYYERAFRKLGKTITCGPSTSKDKRQGIPCGINADIQKITHSIQPDCFILFPEGNFFLPQNIEKITVPKILILSDSFINLHWHKHYAQLFDFVFVAQKGYVSQLKKLGIKNTYWLPNACDPEIHQDLHLERIYDIGFVGTLNTLHNPRRSLYIKILSKHFKSQITSNIWYKEISKIYSQSRIAFNICGAQDLNMRVFETMATGSMLLTDYIPHGLLDLFKDRHHLVTYHSPQEAASLIRYYLTHEDKRIKIAQRGQKEVLDKHTYLHRAQVIISKIKDAKGRTARAGKPSSNLLLAKTYFYINHPQLEKRLLQLTKELSVSIIELPKTEKFKLKIIGFLTIRIRPSRRRIIIAIIKKLEKQRVLELCKWCYYQMLLQTSLNA